MLTNDLNSKVFVEKNLIMFKNLFSNEYYRDKRSEKRSFRIFDFYKQFENLIGINLYSDKTEILCLATMTLVICNNDE